MAGSLTHLLLFVKGLSHDLLLEAGRFLVVVTLILISSKMVVSARKPQDDLKRILASREDLWATDRMVGK